MPHFIVRAITGPCCTAIVWAALSLGGCAPPPPPQRPPAPQVPTIAQSSTPPIEREVVTNSLGMKLVRIPAGEFEMGSAAGDPGILEDELPRHKVHITRSFFMGMYEVTQGEFTAVMQTNPSSFQKGRLLPATETIDAARLPVDGITWHQAVDFCRKLSDTKAEQESGRAYRLPTEAEWEYACRAGTTTTFYFGDALSSTQANFNGAYPFGSAEQGPFLNRTQIVGSYAPNAFGLYDMHGNLFEWCADRLDRRYYHTSPTDDPPGPAGGRYRVIRGGDWYSDARDCRSAFRYSDVPEGTFYALGFRVVCDVVDRSAGPAKAVAKQILNPPLTAKSVPRTASGPTPAPTSGEEWPRWRGLRGDGTWNAPKLATPWPKQGLAPAWTQELGGGYGGVSVAAGRVYVMDRQRDPQSIERVLCFDGVTGKPLWSHQYPVDYQGVAYDNGPRCTPTVHENRVYTLGAVGHLSCLDAASGEVYWSKNLAKDRAARIPLWGLSASPLIFEQLVIVHAGLEPDGCYAAFDLATGEARWHSQPDGAGYATPILIDRHGSTEMVGWTPNHVRGLKPATGELLWSIPFEVNYGTAIADPIFHEGIVLVSSYYDGTKAIRLGATPEAAEVAWEDRRNLRALMAQPLYRDGHVYLIDKRHGLTCLELKTGKKLWDDQNQLTPKGRNPQATLVWLNAEDRAIVLNSDGDLILARFNPQEPAEEARANIIDQTWAHPAYAGNCVYARSDTKLVCVVLP